MDTDDIASALNSLQNKIEDLEIKVGEIFTKQLQTKKELDRIQEKPENVDESDEGKTELQLPDDYHFTEELQKILENMVGSQKAWLESIQTTKKQPTGLKGLKIFKDMNKHLSDRLEYLEMTKTLLEGPLLEELPPVEEPPVEEPKEEVKETKGKKDKGKKK